MAVDRVRYGCLFFNLPIEVDWSVDQSYPLAYYCCIGQIIVQNQTFPSTICKMEKKNMFKKLTQMWQPGINEGVRWKTKERRCGPQVKHVKQSDKRYCEHLWRSGPDCKYTTAVCFSRACIFSSSSWFKMCTVLATIRLKQKQTLLHILLYFLSNLGR